ncbi:MAG: peptidylprolyl isomerase [Phycisphaerales bacterium]
MSSLRALASSPFYFLPFILFLTLVAGCGGNNRKAALTEEEIQEKTYAPLPTRPDEILIGGETITCEDVMMSTFDEDTTGPTLKERLEQRATEIPFDQFLTETRPVIRQRLNRNIITRIVLAKRAKRQLGDKSDDALDKMAEKELRRFIFEEHAGNGAAADAALQRQGMNRTTFKERRKRDMLAQYVVDSKLRRPRPVTYSEIVAKYNEIKDQEYLQEGALQLRLIDIDVAKVPLENAAEDPARKAKLMAEDLRKRIDSGEDFAELARQYSNDPRSAQGGLLSPRAPEAYAAPYDVLARKAMDMERGAVAGPIETAGHWFLMKVEMKQDSGYKPLEDVQGQVREEILRDRRRAALEKLEVEITQQAAITDTTQFVDLCLEKMYRQARGATDEASGTE